MYSRVVKRNILRKLLLVERLKGLLISVKLPCFLYRFIRISSLCMEAFATYMSVYNGHSDAHFSGFPLENFPLLWYDCLRNKSLQPVGRHFFQSLYKKRYKLF